MPGRMLIANDTLVGGTGSNRCRRLSRSERRAGQWAGLSTNTATRYSIPLHTWVEFINRLLGALTGIPALLLLAWAFWRGMKARHWKPFIWAMVHLLLLGLVAWLGKKVVDGNLIPFSITIHMVGAVAILVSLVGHDAVGHPGHCRRAAVAVLGQTKGWLWLATALALAQLVYREHRCGSKSICCIMQDCCDQIGWERCQVSGNCIVRALGWWHLTQLVWIISIAKRFWTGAHHGNDDSWLDCCTNGNGSFIS